MDSEKEVTEVEVTHVRLYGLRKQVIEAIGEPLETGSGVSRDKLPLPTASLVASLVGTLRA